MKFGVNYKAEELYSKRALIIPEKRVVYVVSIVAYQDHVDLTNGFSHTWD